MHSYETLLLECGEIWEMNQFEDIIGLKSGKELKSVRRGYVPEDEKQFTGAALALLKEASAEVQYLLDHSYPVKPTTTFVGNHYMFSERQRLSLARSVSPTEQIHLRRTKELLSTAGTDKLPDMVYIDGFNTIITLEVALSGSPVFLCMDGTIRDLAGLRGTYRIIDKTVQAVNLLLQKLDQLHVKSACMYLDAPVSNSGRLKSLILEESEKYEINVVVEVINDVDRVLEKCGGVISADAIILDHCESWLNLMPEILRDVSGVWMIEL